MGSVEQSIPEGRGLRRRLSKPFSKREAVIREKTCAAREDAEPSSGSTGSRRIRHTLSRPFWRKQELRREAKTHVQVSEAGDWNSQTDRHSAVQDSPTPESPQPLPMDPPVFARNGLAMHHSAQLSAHPKASYDSPRASVASQYRSSFPVNSDDHSQHGSPLPRSVSTPNVRPRASPRSLHRSTPFWEIKEIKKKERQRQKDDESQNELGESLPVEDRRSLPPSLIPEEPAGELQAPVQRQPPSTGALQPEPKHPQASSAPLAADASSESNAAPQLSASPSGNAPSGSAVGGTVGADAIDNADIAVAARSAAGAVATAAAAAAAFPSRSPTSSGFLLPTTPTHLDSDRTAPAREMTSPPAFHGFFPGAAACATPASAPARTVKQQSLPVLPKPECTPSMGRASSLAEASELTLDVDVHKLIWQFETICATAETPTPIRLSPSASPRTPHPPIREMPTASAAPAQPRVWISELMASILRCFSSAAHRLQ